MIDDGALNVFDGYGRLDDTKNTGAFTWSRADASGKFWEVVGFAKTLKRFVPAISVDEVVEFWDEVVDWAAAGHATNIDACVAIRYAAVHTAGRLLLERAIISVLVDFFPILDAFEWRAIRNGRAFKF